MAATIVGKVMLDENELVDCSKIVADEDELEDCTEVLKRKLRKHKEKLVAH